MIRMKMQCNDVYMPDSTSKREHEECFNTNNNPKPQCLFLPCLKSPLSCFLFCLSACRNVIQRSMFFVPGGCLVECALLYNLLVLPFRFYTLLSSSNRLHVYASLNSYR
ncbi:hypothetical protein BJX66DRAFT_157591 [Aspergillus keveii]|uniref:Uncharacterized protein n=1 Tax=Aspergillus keveii TaxID=714993 RepID=A0ABR4GAX6_9EURO